MASITAHFGITDPVQFIDVDLGTDNRLFVDPHAVRLNRAPAPFAADAVRCLDTFLDTITSGARSKDVRSRTRSLKLLQSFHEPWETRMGMSSKGFYGHGGAVAAGEDIWTALTTDLHALLEVGLLRRLEHLPMFVEGVGHDITSDITTRIIFGPLARFTAAMVDQHPEMSARDLVTVQRQTWDPRHCRWQEESLTLPAVDGKPLLLVPRGWAGPRLLVSARRFYETSVLSYAQAEQAAILANGKIIRSPKWALKKQDGLKRGRATNLAVTLRAQGVGYDLIQAFENFVDSKATFDDAA